MHSATLTAELLRWADCVLVHTAHSTYDWGWVTGCARLVVDTRNMVRSDDADATKVVKL